MFVWCYDTMYHLLNLCLFFVKSVVLFCYVLSSTYQFALTARRWSLFLNTHPLTYIEILFPLVHLAIEGLNPSALGPVSRSL
ncbi:hypothetical protein FKM82_005689 [Ascaphus truei]